VAATGRGGESERIRKKGRVDGDVMEARGRVLCPQGCPGQKKRKKKKKKFGC